MVGIGYFPVIAKSRIYERSSPRVLFPYSVLNRGYYIQLQQLFSIIMSDPSGGASTPSAPAQVGTPKKSSAAAASKKPRVKPSHPKTSEMVLAAVKNLKERGGSSLQAIKKYISANYKVDADKLAPFIKKYLKSAVTSGSLVQTKGKGASGSFKLPTAEKSSEAPKKKKKTTKTASKVSKAGGKATPAKKPAAKKLKAKPAAAKGSSPSKTTKKVVAAKPAAAAAKSPASKAKAPPKAKKAAAVAKSSPAKKTVTKAKKAAPTKGKKVAPKKK